MDSVNWLVPLAETGVVVEIKITTKPSWVRLEEVYLCRKSW